MKFLDHLVSLNCIEGGAEIDKEVCSKVACLGPDVGGGSGGGMPQHCPSSFGPIGKLVGVQLWSDSWQDCIQDLEFLQAFHVY